MTQTKTTYCFFCAILLLGLVSNCSPTPPTDALTVQYGPDLQTAYENYKQALVIAYETGDTSGLKASASGYALQEAVKVSMHEDARGIAQWWKKASVSDVRVLEYDTDTAQIAVTVGVTSTAGIPVNIPKVLPFICDFSKEEGQWKITNYVIPLRNE